MEHLRRKRRAEINKALTFIQSSLAYPEPEGYKDFLTRLVRNLLEEGNALFRDGNWENAGKEFSEGLNVSHYAAGEDIQIPKDLLESLFVNRAAAYQNMEQYDRAVKDCDKALEVCKDSSRALYRKALCLKGLGKYKEAYTCITDCLLITRLDKQVNELAQELAVHLGLKARKPYVSAKEGGVTTSPQGSANGNLAAETIQVSGTNLRNGINPLVSFPNMPHSSRPSTNTSCHQPAVASVHDKLDTFEDLEVIGDDLDSLLDCFPNEQEPVKTAFSNPNRTASNTHTEPSVLPAPTPQLPPAFFSSAVSTLNCLDSLTGGRHSTLDSLDDISPLQSLDNFDKYSSGVVGAPNLGVTSTALDALDGLDDLDSLDSLDDFQGTVPSADAVNKVKLPKTELDTEGKSLDGFLDELDPIETISDPSSQSGYLPKIDLNTVCQLNTLDTLDSFPPVVGGAAVLPAVSIGEMGLDSLSDFSSTGVTGSHIAGAPVIRPPTTYKKKSNQVSAASSNPLSKTHEFMPACPACFPREGKGIYTFVHKPDVVHNCESNILLCRRKGPFSSEWTRVRPLPSWNSFTGPHVLCRELMNSVDGTCKYGEKCTFAFNQMEIDVWTEERKGTLDRKLIFEPTAEGQNPVNSIIRLIEEHKGMFIFLCQECYDGKPRIISKRCRDAAVCSNLDAHHTFDTNKCLVFMVRTTSVNYKKIRPLHVLCQLELCRHAIRYGCQREDSCDFAHSVIELKTWKVQQATGISTDEIVMVSTKYHEDTSKQKFNRLSAGGSGGSKLRVGGGGGGGVAKSPDLKMKFVCILCWRDGLISEPDKTLKYCNSKARHTWTKDRRMLLVKSLERNKWVQVRPLPHAKNFPLQYDLCIQILEKKKCGYTGICKFAHSQEEKEMWMYMKNNDLRDMHQMYDMWLSLTTQNRQSDGAMITPSVAEEKFNPVLPTDSAEPISGFYCRLCGKHSNSERQWQQHISTEKHKDRLFSCEGEDEVLMWRYRFPGTCFQLCSNSNGACPEGMSCDYAHSPEELQEWTERRDFLRHKLAKAREDKLIMPYEFDFGKYNFLLQD